jgi:TPR repeat protein
MSGIRRRCPFALRLLCGLALLCGCGAGRPDPTTSALAIAYSPAEYDSAEESRLALLERKCKGGDGESCHDAAMLWREAFRNRSLEARPAIQRLDMRAVELLTPLCEEGAGLACYTVAEIVAYPGNRVRDPKRAAELYEEARGLLPELCERGSVEACGALMTMLGDGLGGPVDVERSDRLYLEALALSAASCEAGDVDLCDRYHVWWYAWMETPDEAAALAHLKAARELFETECERGSATACRKLALTYWVVDLRDGSDNRSKARLWFQRACQLGDAGSCVEAGRLWNVKRSKDRDRVQAREYYERACNGGSATGCIEAADLCLRADVRTARLFLERACELGSATGCRRLADMLVQGYGGAADPARASELITRVRELWSPSCEFGTGLPAAEDCNRLGDLLSEAAGNLAEPTEADTAYAKARTIYAGECRAGDGWSCLMAADLAQRGLGGAPDRKAVEGYRRLTCATDLANQFCEGGKPLRDLEVTIEVDETTVIFDY